MAGGRVRGPPTAATVDALASAAGIAADWWDVSGSRTIVAPETKIALLAALGLEAGSEAQARESLTRLLDDTRRRRIPPSLVLRLDEPLRSRCAARQTDATHGSKPKTESVVEWRIEAGEGARHDLPDGRAVMERPIALPELPVGRHRLVVDGAACALTVAPPECLWTRGGAAQTVRRRGAALRPPPSGGSGDWRLLDAGARGRGRGRARKRPISASARCTCCSRATGSGRAPTTRPTAGSSIRSSSTFSLPTCRATRRSRPRSAR